MHRYEFTYSFCNFEGARERSVHMNDNWDGIEFNRWKLRKFTKINRVIYLIVAKLLLLESWNCAANDEGMKSRRRDNRMEKDDFDR